MLAAAFYLHNARVLCIFTILATVVAITLSVALAHAMRAFLILCHVTLCFLV